MGLRTSERASDRCAFSVGEGSVGEDPAGRSAQVEVGRLTAPGRADDLDLLHGFDAPRDRRLSLCHVWLVRCHIGDSWCRRVRTRRAPATGRAV